MDFFKVNKEGKSLILKTEVMNVMDFSLPELESFVSTSNES